MGEIKLTEGDSHADFFVVLCDARYSIHGVIQVARCLFIEADLRFGTYSKVQLMFPSFSSFSKIPNC